MAPRLLTVGYAQPGYGFGRVMGELHRAFAGAFDLEHFDLARLPSAAADAAISMPARADAAEVWRTVAAGAFDAVFLFCDLEFAAACAARRPPAAPRLVAYVPIDSPVQPSPAWAGLARLDALAVYTRFARDSLDAALARLGLPTPPIHIVPHGIDRAAFFPLHADAMRARADARAALFGDRHALHHAFLVLNANRNQPRKRVDLTLHAFRRFLDLVPDADAKLYLHMGLRDRGVRLLPLAAELGIEDRLLLTGFTLRHPATTDAHLNLIYNACDVGLNTADAEGWGLVAFEHAAARKPQLVPAHTGCGELWRDAGCLIPAARYRDHALDRDAFEVDIGAAAATLARLYRDPALRAQRAERAFRHARDGSLGWNEVGDRLARLLNADIRPAGMPIPSPEAPMRPSAMHAPVAPP